ncbi:helix-turn-helix transcriptional regulator [Kocuria flava]|uniref:helix-turn-helix domain-containing protein n=1 Tax=Kocuria flava TaxID=446860 RepID=UPI002F93294E
MVQHEPIRAVVGRNVHSERERQAMTAEELARRARVAGLNWSTSRVFDLEAGRKAVSLGELLVLAQALTGSGHAVTLPDLLHSADPVEVTDALHIRGEDLRRALTGGTVRLRPDSAPERPHERLLAALEALDVDVDMDALEAAQEAAGAAEDKAAQVLDTDRLTALVAAVALWGRGVSQERDARVDPDSTPQARGHVTRALIAELGEYLRGRRGDR